MYSYTYNNRPIIVLSLVSIFFIVVAIPLQFRLHNLFLVRISITLSIIFLLICFGRFLFFKNLDRQLLRFKFYENRLIIENIDKNKNVSGLREILFGQLKEYSIFEYSKLPRQTCVSFKFKNHIKLRTTLECCEEINGFKIQTPEIIEEVNKSIKKYNSIEAIKIHRVPSFAASKKGLAIIIIFIAVLITSSYFHIKTKQFFPVTTLFAICIYLLFVITRYKELQEIKKFNN